MDCCVPLVVAGPEAKELEELPFGTGLGAATTGAFDTLEELLPIVQVAGPE